MNNREKLKSFLIKKNFKLNSKKIKKNFNSIFYYKHPIVIIFNEDDNIDIKDLLNNRNFKFDVSFNDDLLINFIKKIEPKENTMNVT